ncbi:tetratricopeptide repeat protein [Halodesulfovibrio marinisediminis]|uniref:Tetratricopeptide repeat-containing protein n=1 Tax=Halodesulfovibrio marinisediminis DSM 17456 TaxID=1121457 RepID=A0A1N6IY06_9BACT|nr:tetratricopeptide repeat protein [Halodesulfovibrio marinisediminis]SIO36974.1 Tetratricopeptide repeat-containing protein [Halodesulfovibrio marinisediminis DSM 17456]
MTKREAARLQEEFKKGMYVKKSTTIMCTVFALCLGVFLGNLLTVIYTAQPPAQQSTAIQQSQPTQPQVSQSQASRIIDLERLTRNEPDNISAWQQLGNAYYDANRPEHAIKAYIKSLELDESFPNIWTDLGTMYRRTGQFQKAIESYDNALKFAPTHPNALFNKGIVYLHDLEQKEKGIAAWEELLKSNPSARTPQGKPLKEFIDAHR